MWIFVDYWYWRKQNLKTKISKPTKFRRENFVLAPRARDQKQIAPVIAPQKIHLPASYVTTVAPNNMGYGVEDRNENTWVFFTFGQKLVGFRVFQKLVGFW